MDTQTTPAPSSGADDFSLNQYREQQDAGGTAAPDTPDGGQANPEHEGGADGSEGAQPGTPPGQQQQQGQEPGSEEERKSRTEKRIEQLLTERASWRTRAQMLEAQLADSRRPQQPQPATGAPGQPPGQEELGEPDPTQFDLSTAEGTQKFSRALSAYNRQEAARLIAAERQRMEQQFQQQLAGQQASASWEGTVGRARAAHQDYDQVALHPDLPVSPETAGRLRQMQNGGEVLYQLGKNPQLAARIYPLSGAALDRALGGIEHMIEAAATPGTPQQQQQPPQPGAAASPQGPGRVAPPPTTLSGQGPQGSKLSTDLPLDEYRRRAEAGAEF